MRLPVYDIDKRHIHVTKVYKRVTFLLNDFQSYAFIYSIIIIRRPTSISPRVILGFFEDVRRLDISTTQREGDTIIVQHVASVGAPNSLIDADDTDVIVLCYCICVIMVIFLIKL